MICDDDATALAGAAGNADVYARAFARHEAALRNFVASRVSDRSSVDDVMQDVYVRSYLAVGDLRDPGRFRPWLMSIARNACADEHRRRSRFVPLGDDEADRPDTAPTPAELNELTVLAGLVNGCVAGLSRRDAAALTLVVRFGLDVSELAEALGVSNGTARVILHRARRRLGEALSVSVLATSGGGCARLQAVLDAHDYVKATMHVLDCEACRTP